MSTAGSLSATPTAPSERTSTDLGALDDGVIDYIDAGLLLATRLQRAGIDTTFDVLPGRHEATDIVPEIVAYLLDAAGTK